MIIVMSEWSTLSTVSTYDYKESVLSDRWPTVVNYISVPIPLIQANLHERFNSSLSIWGSTENRVPTRFCRKKLQNLTDRFDSYPLRYRWSSNIDDILHTEDQLRTCRVWIMDRQRIYWWYLDTVTLRIYCGYMRGRIYWWCLLCVRLQWRCLLWGCNGNAYCEVAMKMSVMRLQWGYVLWGCNEDALKIDREWLMLRWE